MVENIDRWGHCVKCHKNLSVDRVVDGKSIKMFLPDKEETEFILDDGSRMRVCICRPCKIDRDLTDESIQREIMDSVIEGWRLEIRGLVEDENRKDWDAEKGNRHMEIYSRKRIVAHSDSLSSHMAEDKIKKIREK